MGSYIRIRIKIMTSNLDQNMVMGQDLRPGSGSVSGPQIKIWVRFKIRIRVRAKENVSVKIRVRISIRIWMSN